jgi:pyruvate dehydrogenase E1 component
MATLPDYDPQETQEWLDALEAVLENEGADRVHFLLGQLIDKARSSGAGVPFSATTPYCNTIPVGDEQRSTGNHDLEHRIRALMRWNAMALVLNANKDSSELGGHIASFASAATLYDVAFNHFFHGKTDTHGGDLVYSRAIRHPVCTRALSSKAASPKNKCTSSARKRTAADCRLIPTPG